MIRDELSTVDFFYGRFYVDYWDNPDVYANERFVTELAKYPNYKRFGENFKAANMKYISSRK